MTNHEHTTDQPSAQALQNEVIALHERKNWPDPRENWLMYGEDGPVTITSLVATAPHPESGNQRYELAGGMSPAWGQPQESWVAGYIGSVTLDELNLMPDKLKELPEQRQAEIRDERKVAAKLQMSRYLELLGGSELSNDVIIMKPQIDHYKDRTIPGNIVNADEISRNGDYIEDTRPAFMMYSQDTERVIGIRPADCPTLHFSGVDKDGKPAHGVIHAGWQDEDAGFVTQGMEFLHELGVDMSSLHVYIAPGGVEFGYTRPTNPLDGDDPSFVSDWRGRLTDVHPVNPDNPDDRKTRFTIDMIGRAVDDMYDAGITPQQIFIDSTDTSDERTGNSSHKQASRGVQVPTRDVALTASQYRLHTLGIR